MFAHLQVHMQMENHYSSAHKGATYKEVHIYGIFQQRSNRSSDSRHRTGCRSRHLGSHQSAGRLRQRQPCDTFVSEKLTHKVEGLSSLKLWRTDIPMSEMRE